MWRQLAHPSLSLTVRSKGAHVPLSFLTKLTVPLPLASVPSNFIFLIRSRLNQRNQIFQSQSGDLPIQKNTCGLRARSLPRSMAWKNRCEFGQNHARRFQFNVSSPSIVDVVPTKSTKLSWSGPCQKVTAGSLISRKFPRGCSLTPTCNPTVRVVGEGNVTRQAATKGKS
jgi:hypothetical protein